MKQSRKNKREARLGKLRARDNELNIVSMIDVFAVLVFFLLVSSSVAASRLNVIGLNLPSPDALPPAPQEQPLALTVVLRAGGLTVSARGNAQDIPKTPEGYALDALSNFLVEVKKNNPTEQSITVLMEPEIAYDDLVRVMDAARLAPAEARAQGLPREMFPSIALGDAAAPAAAAIPVAP